MLSQLTDSELDRACRSGRAGLREPGESSSSPSPAEPAGANRDLPFDLL